MLEKVNIPHSITTIEMEAFKNCTALNNVVIPKTVTTMGDSVFAGCSALSNLSYEERNTEITLGAYLLNGCTAITEIILPTGINYIPDYMFANTGLTNVVIPEAITDLSRNGIFMNCAKLTSITFHGGFNGVLGAEMFRGCTALKAITLPENTSSVGEYLFEGCTALTDVQLPKTLSMLSKGMFMNCTSLKTIDLPNCWELAESLFEGCTSLESVLIPASCSGILAKTFKNCTGLKNVEFAEGAWLMYIYDGAFENCTAIEEIRFCFGMMGPVGYFDGSPFRGWASNQKIVMGGIQSYEQLGQYYGDYGGFDGCNAEIVLPDMVTAQ